MPGSQYTLKILTGADNLAAFDCTDKDLNEFLTTDALQNYKDWLSVTHLLFNAENIPVGYFTITLDTLHKGRIALHDKLNGYPYQKYPAIKLARLAVDKRYQHRGIGTILMKYFFIEAYSLMKTGGGRFITVDAKNSAKGFYEQFGFRTVPSQKDAEIISMYLDFYKYYNKE